MKNKTIHLKYKEYLSEQSETIIQAMKIHNKILMTAPTGGGKTFTVTNVMKSFKDRLNIILTPNVIQNKQNATKYGVQAFTGNDRKINSRYISATYDKARALIDYIKENKENFNLFIDECHLLVEASNYRMRAIRDILELKDLADKVVYMSATNDYMRDILDYDIELNIQPLERKNNIATSQILLLDSKNVVGSLIHQIDQVGKTNGRKTVLFLDDLNQLVSIKTVLLTRGYRDDEIAIISSKGRNDYDQEVYNNIISCSQIPKQTKIILTTSVLEVGTNIDTKNVNIFVYIPKFNHLNLNKICQQVARFRVKPGQTSNNVLKICLPYREKEDNRIKSFDKIKKELRVKVENNINWLISGLNSVYKDQNNDTRNKFIQSTLASPMSLYNVQDSFSLGVIELDEENSMPVINEFKLQRKAKEIYESQFFYNTAELEKKLKSMLSVDDWLETVNIKSEDFKEEAKAIANAKKELKDEKKDRIKEIFEKIKKDRLEDIFVTKVSEPDLDTQITFIEEAYKELESTNILKLTRQADRMGIEPLDMVKSFAVNGDSETKNKRQFLGYKYIEYNNKYLVGAELPTDGIKKEYLCCRKVLDDICKKQGRISQNIKQTLLIELIRYNVVKDSGKYVIIKGKVYEHKKNDSGDQPKPLSKKQIDNLTMQLITLVYNLKRNDTEISSLKTK